ncbi:MAG: hypothetical protein NZ899_15090 [Thermoguttaceae bacterium]|nr:hypothetical protein [Thermoguttaceae bacterium]MDW8077613.1 hypothetical protein [Thermoguttaceae bacterium]
MPPVVHRVTLQTSEPIGSRLPPRETGSFLARLADPVRAAIGIAVCGTTRPPGRTPERFRRAPDIRFIGHQNGGIPSLLFEAPPPGEAAPEIYEQEMLWPEVLEYPPRDETAIDLFGEALIALEAEDTESRFVDPGMLKKVLPFKRAFGRLLQAAEIGSHRLPNRQFARLTPATLAPADNMYKRTPPPRSIRLAGVPDMVRVSTPSFGVKLETGQELRGPLTEGSIGKLAYWLGRPLLVGGRAVYGPSGGILRGGGMVSAGFGKRHFLYESAEAPAG